MTTLEESTIKASSEDTAREFRDEEYRYAYAEDFLNTWIATQIVTLREQRGLSQEKLGELIGTKQPGVSRLENVNHSTWRSDTLKKIARALGVRLKVTFETFGTLLDEDRNFCREYLQRPNFTNDPFFCGELAEEKLATRSLESAMSRLLRKAEPMNARSEEGRGRGAAASVGPVGNGMPHGATCTIGHPTGDRIESLTAVAAGYTSQQSHMQSGVA